jgi:hypothetical protein
MHCVAHTEEGPLERTFSRNGLAPKEYLYWPVVQASAPLCLCSEVPHDDDCFRSTVAIWPVRSYIAFAFLLIAPSKGQPAPAPCGHTPSQSHNDPRLHLEPHRGRHRLRRECPDLPSSVSGVSLTSLTNDSRLTAIHSLARCRSSRIGGRPRSCIGNERARGITTTAKVEWGWTDTRQEVREVHSRCRWYYCRNRGARVRRHIHGGSSRPRLFNLPRHLIRVAPRPHPRRSRCLPEPSRMEQLLRSSPHRQ